MRIVRTKLYVKALKRMGVDAKDIAALELSVASDPAAGDVIRGLKGIRKIRFGFGGPAPPSFPERQPLTFGPCADSIHNAQQFHG